MEENERQAKGIYIPIEIWKDKSLSWNEKILFLEIDSFTTQDKDCYISNEYIAKLLNVGETTANKILSSLIKKGYVIKTRFDGRQRFVKSALHFTTRQGCTEVQGWVADCDNSNNIIYNKTHTVPKTITYKEKEKEKEKESAFEIFNNFVKLYKKLTKKPVRGTKTEFEDFKKRHRDWEKVLPYLSTAIERETKERENAKANGYFFPEPKMLQTYLGKQRAWELYVSVGEDLNMINNEYIPEQSPMLMWNDYYKCYMYTGYWDGHISDGYEDDNRPDGASVTLNNGRGTIVWSNKTKQWIKQ
jgi:hypothetical protein